MEALDTSWDVDKYRSDHEPSHHWELRRKFMESNKGRYPEARLVGLAQVFGNIEFMGCRYNYYLFFKKSCVSWTPGSI